MEGEGSRMQLLHDRVSGVEQGFLSNRVQGERATLFCEGTEHQKEESVFRAQAYRSSRTLHRGAGCLGESSSSRRDRLCLEAGCCKCRALPFPQRPRGKAGAC